MSVVPLCAAGVRPESGGRNRVGLEEEQIDVLLDVPH
jgi:hypothetical protein